MRAAVKGELGNRFRPEFLNRLDEVVVFSSLARAEVEQVAALMIDEVVAALRGRRRAHAHLHSRAQGCRGHAGEG